MVRLCHCSRLRKSFVDHSMLTYIASQVNIDFEPFKPINTSLYLCDNKFHTEALNEVSTSFVAASSTPPVPSLYLIVYSTVVRKRR